MTLEINGFEGEMVKLGVLRNSDENELAKIVWNAALEEAAKVAESKIDLEWPGDDMSVQAETTASEIRSLKEE